MRQPLRVGIVGARDSGVQGMHMNSIDTLEEEGLVKLVAIAESDTENMQNS